MIRAWLLRRIRSTLSTHYGGVEVETIKFANGTVTS
jgi:Fe-S cluster biogenesis protein NfuA